MKGLATWDTSIMIIHFKKHPKIIHNTVILYIHPSSKCVFWLYCSQCAVLLCFYLAFQPPHISSESVHQQKSNTKVSWFWNYFPKHSEENTCELTSPEHPKQTITAQTGLPTWNHRNSPPHYLETPACPLHASMGKHIYCQHSVRETEQNKKIIFFYGYS